MRATTLIGLLSLAWTTAASGADIEFTTTASGSHLLMSGDGRLSVAVDLAAPSAERSAPLPMNIALVIDRSGSMLGEKIDQTRKAAAALVGKLGEKDTLSIVSYSDDVRVDIHAQRVTRAVRDEALAAIEQLDAGGSTNLSGGLLRGQDEVARNFATGQVNRVILMSDGLANRGITDTKAIAQAAQQGAQRGVSVTTMGVGTDYNEDLMTAVADQASGNYYFIQTAAAISGVLSTELQRMFSTVAQNTSVTIRLADGTEFLQAFGYTYRRGRDEITIPLAELFGGQRRSILFEVSVPALREGKLPVVSVTLRYDAVAPSARRIETTNAVEVMVTRNADLVSRGRNKRVEERIEEVRAATVMTQAADLLRAGQADEAKRLVREEAGRLRARATALGGSGRVESQAKELEQLQYDFDDNAAAPAAVKATKARAYELSK